MTPPVAPPPPPPQQQMEPPPVAYQAPGGVMQYGTPRKPVMVILYSILTLGIYSLYWNYQIAEENKNVAGVGPGGLVHLLLMFIPFANIYRIIMITAETGEMQALNGMPKTVSGLTFFWIFLPLLGGFVRLFKLQNAVNSVWYLKGAPRTF